MRLFNEKVWHESNSSTNFCCRNKKRIGRIIHKLRGREELQDSLQTIYAILYFKYNVARIIDFTVILILTGLNISTFILIILSLTVIPDWPHTMMVYWILCGIMLLLKAVYTYGGVKRILGRYKMKIKRFFSLTRDFTQCTKLFADMSFNEALIKYNNILNILGFNVNLINRVTSV
jgi:hypothetical protein